MAILLSFVSLLFRQDEMLDLIELGNDHVYFVFVETRILDGGSKITNFLTVTLGVLHVDGYQVPVPAVAALFCPIGKFVGLHNHPVNAVPEVAENLVLALIRKKHGRQYVDEVVQFWLVDLTREGTDPPGSWTLILSIEKKTASVGAALNIT